MVRHTPPVHLHHAGIREFSSSTEVLLCRVIGGRVNYTDEVTPDPEVCDLVPLPSHFGQQACSAIPGTCPFLHRRGL